MASNRVLSMPNVDVVGAFNASSGVVKVVVVLAIILVGFGLYSKWTGRSYGPINLLGQNALGNDIAAAQARWQARVQGRLHTQVTQP